VHHLTDRGDTDGTGEEEGGRGGDHPRLPVEREMCATSEDRRDGESDAERRQRPAR
jgi:hypothetical protein